MLGVVSRLSSFPLINLKEDPVDTGRKLNVHKTFRRRPGRLLNFLCTFSLRPVFTGEVFSGVISHGRLKFSSFIQMG